jgi:ABC-type transporter MlaC component
MELSRFIVMVSLAACLFCACAAPAPKNDVRKNANEAFDALDQEKADYDK